MRVQSPHLSVLSPNIFMKTHILQLESHDDVISTRDKMGWDQAGRIALVWPERGRILTRKLDLVLLQRRCVEIGAQMALVTSDAQVRDYAHELHIPVFDSTLQAQNNRWRGSRKRPLRRREPGPRPDFEALRQEAHPQSPAWMTKPAARLGFFALGVIAFLSVVAVLLPGADIALTPKTQVQETGLSVYASTNVGEVHLIGEAPAYTTTVVVEGRQTISTTGVTQVPEKSATGYVRFTNLTEQAVDIPKGTIVLTTTEAGVPVNFITTSDGEVQAGPGTSASLLVRAMDPGPDGNVPANSLTALEGPLGLSLAVTNPVSTFGGTNRSAAAPNLKDYAQLADRLTSSLAKTALAEFRRDLDPQDILITSTLKLINRVNTYDPPAPTNSLDAPLPADELNLTSRQTMRIMVVSGKNLKALANLVLDANLSDNLTVVPDTLDIQSITAPTSYPDGSARWQIHARRTVQANLNQSQVINLVLGRQPAEALRLLQTEIPLERPPTIRLLPYWWPVMPVMSFRINVSIR
jgi:hypothetical protein